MPTSTPRKRAAAAPARKRAASPARATRAGREPEPDIEPEISEAEAQEVDANRYVTASLAGEAIRAIPNIGWRLSWESLLSSGRTVDFLGKILHPEDLDYVVDDLDPTGEELQQFLQDLQALTGEPVGKSAGPSRSSRSTRRR